MYIVSMYLQEIREKNGQVKVRASKQVSGTVKAGFPFLLLLQFISGDGIAYLTTDLIVPG